jgi:hypothetical protein
MADKKISALTSATTPLAGTEVLPIVQGGATVKVAVSNLTAGRAIDVTNLIATGYAALANGTTATTYVGKGSDLVSGAGANDTAIRWDGISGNFLFAANSTKVASFDVTGNLSLVSGNFVVSNGKGIDFSATAGAGTSELLADYEEGTWTPSQGAGLTVIGAFSSTGTYTKIGRIVTVTGAVNGATSVAATSGNALCGGLPFAAGSTSSGIAYGVWTAPSGAAVISSTLYSATAIAATGTILFSVTYQV